MQKLSRHAKNVYAARQKNYSRENVVRAAGSAVSIEKTRNSVKLKNGYLIASPNLASEIGKYADSKLKIDVE